MTESVRVSGVVGASLERVYDAFLDAGQHTAMTGGPAEIQPVQGTPFTAWDGYIHGTNLFLERPRRIVQSWRASDFPDAANDSMVEIQLDATDAGTEITIVHTGLPIGMSRGFLEGWHKFYLEPMKIYFAAEPKKGAAPKAKAAPKKAAPKPKKAAPKPKKAAPKPKKAAPKKAPSKPKKAAPKPKKAAPKKAAPKKAAPRPKKAAARAKKTSKRG